MNKETFNKILETNKTFYENIAISFDKTRQYPWKGWERVVDEIQRLANNYENKKIKILDIACGNGRFLKYLANNANFSFEYIGIDQNNKLLDEAKSFKKTLNNNSSDKVRKHLNDVKNSQFLQADVIIGISDLKNLTNKNSQVITEGGFDVITAFGITHHIPSLEFRQNWLLELKKLLNNRGLIILTLWNYHKDIRFKPLGDSEIKNKINITPHELENGDYFLGWKCGNNYRYTHIYSDTEISQIIKYCGLDIVNKFDSDGKSGTTNKYLILSTCRN